MVVHAETGEPVARVTVNVNTGRGGMGFGSGANETITDTDGRFRIASLAPGIYDLEARADELYGEGAEQVHVGLSQSVDDLVIEVHPTFSIAGKIVIAETNAPCSEGEITLEGNGLLPGTYELDIWGDTHPKLPQPEVVTIEATDLDGVRLMLPATGRLVGIVRDETGAAAPGVRVTAASLTRRKARRWCSGSKAASR